MSNNLLSKNIIINDKIIQGSLNCLSSYKSLKIFSKTDVNNIKEIKNQCRNQIQQIIDTKIIKNDQFIFRMKLKLISCLQQLEIEKQQIQNIRKLQNDTQILQYFTTQIKKQFNTLKKYKQQSLLRKQQNNSSRNSSKNIQALQKISLQSQLSQYVQSQKRLKLKCQKLFTQSAQLLQRIKQKQHIVQQTSNKLYQMRLQNKQSYSVIQNLKISYKKNQKEFIRQKQRLIQQLNNLKQYISKQRQLKHNYTSKLQIKQIQYQQKQNIIKRYKQEIQFLKKQNIKWKNRSEWKEKQSTSDTKETINKIYNLETQNQLFKQTIKQKQTELLLLSKSQNQSQQLYHKKLEKIVEEWKDKLIQNVQQYQAIIQKNQSKLNQAQNIINILQREKQTFNEQISLKKQQNYQIIKQNKQLTQKIEKLQKEVSKKAQFYQRKIQEQLELIEHLEQQNMNYRKEAQDNKKYITKYQANIKQEKHKYIDLFKKLSTKQDQILRLKAQNQRNLQEQKIIIVNLQRQKAQILKEFEQLGSKCEQLQLQVNKNLNERQFVKKYLQLKKQNQTDVPINVLFKKEILKNNSKPVLNQRSNSPNGSQISKISSTKSTQGKDPIIQVKNK